MTFTTERTSITCWYSIRSWSSARQTMPCPAQPHWAFRLALGPRPGGAWSGRFCGANASPCARPCRCRRAAGTCTRRRAICAYPGEHRYSTGRLRLRAAPLKQEKQEPTGDHPRPRGPMAFEVFDTICAAPFVWWQSAEYTLQCEIGCALGGAVGEPSPHDRRLSARHRIMAALPQPRGVAPPPAVAQIADEIGIQNACQDFAVRPRQSMKCCKQLIEIADQAERRKIGGDKIDGMT